MCCDLAELPLPAASADWVVSRFGLQFARDVPRALHGRDPALPMVLLAHHPSTIARAAPAGVDLQLSGHTHGGQLLPLGWLVRLFEPQAAGLGRHGRTWLYVNEGTGYWGPPLRVGTTQEITLVTLRRA